VSGFDVSVVPVGKIKSEEVEAAMSRAARVLRRPLELKGSLPVPQGVEDVERGQFRAANLLNRLRASFPQLGSGRMIGVEEGEDAKPPLKPGGILFITDVDLYTANSDAVFTALLSAKRLGVVSLRRLREAFYRRSADPSKQRARLTKEIVRAAARLSGMPECRSPQCVISASNMLADIDLKEEKLCRACSQRMFQGTVRI
jgi:predicted Zn-dependent protease